MQSKKGDKGREIFYKLAELAGSSAAIEILKEFQGQIIYFPLVETIYKPARDKKICELYGSGMSIQSIAQEFELGTDRVRQIVHKGT